MASELKIASAFFFDEAFADLLLRGERAADGRDLDALDEPAGARARARRGSLGDQLAGAGVPEVRGVRALDADAAVRGLAPR